MTRMNCRVLTATLIHYISEYMGVLVLLSAIVALVFPEVMSRVRPTVINPLLGVIMFGMGMTLRADDFHIVFSRPKDIVIGCLAQFTVMPLLAWTLARAFALDEALTVGVVLVAAALAARPRTSSPIWPMATSRCRWA